MMIENYDNMVDVLLKLKKYGMRISLDDFGKGYSSLSYLNQLPIDTLKIDREFLESSQYHGKGYKLIGTIIDIANKFDYIVIAEGVETKEQLEILKQLNCYGGQGYLMCPPVPVRELIPFIEANNL
jgi:EAL domain-containing protein (putative c-di-GMP-specific phosphodiesterase class I)